MKRVMSAVAAIAAVIAITGVVIWYYSPSLELPGFIATPSSTVRSIKRAAVATYTSQTFDLASVQGISQDQLNQHQHLYVGYVKKRNEIAQDLQTVDRSHSSSRTYSPFRSLKLAETYAVNGSILHELYFQNISQPGNGKPGPLMMELVEQNYGSLENFKQDFMDCGGSSRGWVVTSYSIDDGLMHNYVFEEHNQHVPVLTIPLLVLDVYEHAYMIDFGIKRRPYLDAFWNTINWDVVEQRIATWVNPLRQTVQRSEP